jgi:hypothetical protein
VDANEGLDAEGLLAFDPQNENDRTKAIVRTIGVSLDFLAESERARFGELGIFPEDADVPIDIVERLWVETGSLKKFAIKKLPMRLHDLSLLLNLDLNQRLLRLHDTIRHFLQDQAGKGRPYRPAQAPKSALFAVPLMIFNLLEKAIERKFWPHAAGGGDEIDMTNLRTVLSVGIVMFVALLPVFGMRELGKVVGPSQMYKLFFVRRMRFAPLPNDPQANPSTLSRRDSRIIPGERRRLLVA